MKRLLAAGLVGIAALLVPSTARAQSAFYEVTRGSGAIHNVIIATGAAVGMDLRSADRKLVNRSSIEIYNDDSSDIVRCGFVSGVSTGTANVLLGRPIAPGTPWVLSIPDAVNVYCTPEGVGAGALVEARLIITQL